MPKALVAAALMAVIAIDRISFDNEIYEPGSKIDGLRPDQADGLVDNGHAKHVQADAEPTDAELAAKAAALEAAAKPAATKAAAKK